MSEDNPEFKNVKLGGKEFNFDSSIDTTKMSVDEFEAHQRKIADALKFITTHCKNVIFINATEGPSVKDHSAKGVMVVVQGDMLELIATLVKTSLAQPGIRSTISAIRDVTTDASDMMEQISKITSQGPLLEVLLKGFAEHVEKKKKAQGGSTRAPGWGAPVSE